MTPKIDKALCVDCGLCDKACPLGSGQTEKPAEAAYLFYHGDAQYRMTASSSGAFEAVCRGWIGDDAVSVFGCAMQPDGRSACHMEASSWQELQQLKKSKYVQSDTKDAYRQVKHRLKAGRRVVFVGTPCQVMGLKNYLGKPWENLLTVDFVCHGTPSPLALERYIAALEKTLGCRVKNFSFRNKQQDGDKGWSSLGVMAVLEDGTAKAIPWEQCEYMIWFLQGALSAECCYSCRFASTSRCADVTLGDFWGVERLHPELGEKETDGVSLLLLNTDKGRAVGEFLRNMPQVRWEEHPICAAARSNKQLTAPAQRHVWRDSFYKYLEKTDFTKALSRLTYGNLFTRVKRKCARLLKRGNASQ